MSNSQGYQLLPFRFSKFNEGRLIVNESGEFHYLSNNNFSELCSGNIDYTSSLFSDLKSKNFIAQDNLVQAIDMTATRYRTRKHFLDTFTTLHMMVITLRCNHRCEYCQVSCEDADAYKFDMTVETAKRIVDTIFMSPSPSIKIEFQGGESLLNWRTIIETVKYAHIKNASLKKLLRFVICTNLTLIDKEKLEFIKEYDIDISTSLDGPKRIHDKNRVMRTGNSSHDLFIQKLELSRSILRDNQVSALMTMSAISIDHVRDVINEYIRLDFKGIFLRSLNPYGFAAQKAEELGYSAEKFVESYIDALDYIISINKAGVHFSEFFTTLLLTRILTPFSTGFVDLQSPSGAGISGAIYDYNGDVYPADEGRMLARMGDKNFLMGNVFTDSYADIFNGPVIQEIVNKSCLDIMPVCSDCVYMAYCGSDPIRNYREYKDVVGKRPGSQFCTMHRTIFDHIFKLILNNDRDTMDIFWSWITRCSLEDVRHESL